MAVDDATNVAAGWFKASDLQFIQIVQDQGGNLFRRFRKPFARYRSGRTANKNRIHDRRTGAADMDRRAHFRRAGD